MALARREAVTKGRSLGRLARRPGGAKLLSKSATADGLRVWARTRKLHTDFVGELSPGRTTLLLGFCGGRRGGGCGGLPDGG